MDTPLTCADARDRYLAWLDNALEPDEATALQAHLADCADCRAEAEDLAAVHRDLCVQAAKPLAERTEGIPAVLEALRAEGARIDTIPVHANGRVKGSPSRSMKAVRARLRASRTAPRTLAPALAAATVLVAAGAILLLTRGDRQAPDPGRDERTPAVARTEPATAATEPTAPPSTRPVIPAAPPRSDTDAAPVKAPSAGIMPEARDATPRPRDARQPGVSAPMPEPPPPAPPAVIVHPEKQPTTAPPADETVPIVPTPRPAGPVVARIDAAEGKAFIVTERERIPATPGIDVRAGQGLETPEGRNRLAVRYADGTRFELRGGTVVRRIAERKTRTGTGKAWTLETGDLRVAAARQPADAPLVVTTPNAEVTVLGTTFEVHAAAEATRVEVRTGKVKLKRLADRRAATIPAGYFGVAAKGIPIAARISRVDKGLAALYRFREGAGDVVEDEAGGAPPLHLRIRRPGMTEWLAHGLRLRGPAHIESAATRIAKDYRKQHAITFEAWVRPEAPAAKEPAPILQLTGCSLHQFVLIGHGALGGSKTAYRGFLMPPDPGDMKSGWITAPEHPVGPRLTHVVLTRERGGTRLYIDGVERATGRIPAEVPHCQYPLRLVLGSSPGDAAAWRGEIHHAAVYARALVPDEVKRNKLAGCGGAACGITH